MENICYDTLKEWAEDNAAVPQDENRAFVIAYKVDSKIWCGFENLMFIALNSADKFSNEQ